MKIKEKVEESLYANSDFINEYILCERLIEDDYYETPYPDETDAENANIYRRTLCILLFLLGKEEGIIPGFSFNYEKDEYVGFDSDLYCFANSSDETYSSAMEKFLKNHDWDFPSGWNTYYDLDSYDRDTAEFKEEFLKKEKVAYDECFYCAAPVTLHNSKFDEVYRINKKLKNNSEAAEDYAEIWSLVTSIVYNGISHTHAGEDVYFMGKCIYFTVLMDGFTDFCEIEHFVDYHRLLSPKLLIHVPRLDKMMDSFIKKWK